jgi:hypothetical protein
LAPAQVTQQFANVLSTVRPQVASQILAQLAITNDAALLASQPTPMPDKLGGINLSNEHLTLNVKVDGAGMPLPPQYQDKALLNLNGLVSVIRSITPITKQNVPALYELAK